MTNSGAFVYVLRSIKTGNYYIGCSENPQRRLAEHNAGESASTRGRGPWELVYKKRFDTLADARRYERELKGKKSSRYIGWLISQG